MPPIPRGYTVSLSRSRQDDRLEYVEDVLYNSVRVGGFRLWFEPAEGTPLRQFTHAVVRNNVTREGVDQEIAISYDGTVVARATFRCSPPPEGDPVHGLECSSWMVRTDAPMRFDCQVLG